MCFVSLTYFFLFTSLFFPFHSTLAVWYSHKAVSLFTLCCSFFGRCSPTNSGLVSIFFLQLATLDRVRQGWHVLCFFFSISMSRVHCVSKTLWKLQRTLSPSSTYNSPNLDDPLNSNPQKNSEICAQHIPVDEPNAEKKKVRKFPSKKKEKQTLCGKKEDEKNSTALKKNWVLKKKFCLIFHKRSFASLPVDDLW